MQSDVIVNVKDISSKDIVVPDTSANTPNTGYLGVDDNVGGDINASSDGFMVQGIVGVVVVVTVILLSLVAKRHHVRLLLRRNKHVARVLVLLAIVTSALSFVGLKELNNSYNQAKAEGSTVIPEDS